MKHFVHPQGLCESEKVGEGTRVWAFAHVLPGAVLGRDCNICDNVFVENDVVVGDRVTVKCGVQLWDGVTLEDDVFVGPNATFTNDKFPRSKQYPTAFPRTVVRKGASIGANATILPGITIGSRAMIGAGAVVTRSVPPNAIVAGNPARIVGYAETPVEHAEIAQAPREASAKGAATGVRGVTVHRFPVVQDMRGALTVGNLGVEVPFVPKRYFMVYDVPSSHVRGEHAHKECHQFLVCTQGSMSVLADDGKNRCEVVLDSPAIGVYLPPMIWGVQYKHSKDALLLVFASHAYDAKDYVRDYDEFVALASAP